MRRMRLRLGLALRLGLGLRLRVSSRSSQAVPLLLSWCSLRVVLLMTPLWKLHRRIPAREGRRKSFLSKSFQIIDAIGKRRQHGPVESL